MGQLMHIISVSDFCLLDEHGGARSRGLSFRKNDWGVSRIFFGYTRHARGIQYSPCKLTNQETRSYESPSAVSMHPSLEAKPTRSNATDGRQDEGKPCTAKIERKRRILSGRRSTCDIEKAKSQDQGCPPIRVGKGDCTTKSASHGEPAGDRVRLSEEW